MYQLPIVFEFRAFVPFFLAEAQPAALLCFLPLPLHCHDKAALAARELNAVAVTSTVPSCSRPYIFGRASKRAACGATD